jgi:tRNA (guanine-N7-)-methyltransferase
MRQRKPKNLEDKLTACRHVLVETPESRKGRWRETFDASAVREHDRRALFLELGTGKGRFIAEKALRNPDCLYIGVEGRDGVLLRAAERAAAAGLSNLLLARVFVRDPGLLFAAGELSGLYLNFCDPWPKDRHAKRRLTHRAYLARYKEILRPGACLEFKTDNRDFFEFSLAEIAATAGVSLLESSLDLHGSALSAKESMTEYEEKFVRRNRCICYLRARF